MEKEFWNLKWEKDQIGFHQDEYNPYMIKYFEQFANQDLHVFIPLAGKTKDILWFLAHGFRVTAIEIIEKAVIDFHQDNNIKADKKANCYHSNNLDFYHGDVFELALNEYDFIYDRASLIAFPIDLRNKLIHYYSELINKGATLFSIVINYDESLMQGPPFSISSKNFCKYFEGFSINEIHKTNSKLNNDKEIDINQNSFEVKESK
jgi:thiopurine S-methyltransferase